MSAFKRIISILFLILSLFPSKLFPFNNDTTKNTSENVVNITRYFNGNQFEYVDSIFSIDQSLYDFSNYLTKNTLGNNGLPIHPVIYNPFSSPLGFNFYKNNYSDYFFSPHKLKFYNTRTPYTDVFYMVGTKKEQLFKMTFSYNVKKNFNITADFHRIASKGFYERQNTSDNFISLSTNFKSENNRYWLLGSLIYNEAENSESGGINNDSAFDMDGPINMQLLKVNLTAATRTVINRDIYLKQIFNLGRKDTDSSKAIIPSSRFILTSIFDDNYISYVDDNPTVDYYSHIYYNSQKTFDSTYYYKIENEIAWKRLDNLRHRGFCDMVGFGANVKHQYISLKQRQTDTLLNNIIAGGELYNTYSKNAFWFNISSKYILDGYNKGDNNSILIFRKDSKDSLNSIIMKGESRVQTPDYIYSKYLSNHYVWNNNFEKMSMSSAEISLKIKKHKLELTAGIKNYKNVLYFDNYATPRQYSGSISVFTASLKKDFVFMNWHLNNKIIYQRVPDSTVIRLPEFIFEHSLYYENDLLNKALRLQIGASVYYISSYYADSYMPVTGQFFIQNDKKFGNYPFVDFFVSAKIKTVRIFFKADHINSGWAKNNYILTPGYPYSGRTFKLGVSWKFFD